MKLNCIECDKPFIRKGMKGHRKYCSVTCRCRHNRKSVSKTFPNIGTTLSRQTALKDISKYIKECDSFFNRNYLNLESDVLLLSKIKNETINIDNLII